MSPLRASLLPLLALLAGVAGSNAQTAPPVTEIGKVIADDITGPKVQFRAVVTCVEENQFFIQDATGAMLVQQPNAARHAGVGDEVLVEGDIVRPESELVFAAHSIRKTGVRPLPEPEPHTTTTLGAQGKARAQRVKVKGSIQDVAMVRDEVHLQLWNYDAPVVVIWHHPGPASTRSRPDHLLDAMVEVTGVAQPAELQKGLGRSTSARVILASPADLRVLEPGSPDVFSRPLRSLASLRKTPSPYAERYRVIGTVSFAAPKRPFYLQDDSGVGYVSTARNFLKDAPSVRRPISANPEVHAGDVVEVVGQVYHWDHEEKFIPLLAGAEWRILRHARPPPFQPVSAATIMAGLYDGQSVSIAGRVVSSGIQNTGTMPALHMLTLDDDGTRFIAMIDLSGQADMPFKAGEYVRVNGVVMAITDRKAVTTSFRIWVNSGTDILGAPEPWNREMFVRWLLGGAGIALGALVWIVLLRRQVHLQTARLQQLNQDLARFKQVAETTTDLVAMASLDQVPLYFNPSGRAMLGIPLDEDATRISFTSVYTNEALERFQREGFAHALEHGHWEAEISMLHRNGTVIPVSFVGLVLRTEDGQPFCMSCIARDISTRRKMEQHLRDSLDHERQLNELKSSFVNTISHEFRTPLGIILFAASMLRRFDSRYGPEERAGQLTAIEEAVARMNELVGQSLNLGRADAAVPQAQDVDLEMLCRSVIDEVQSSSAETRCIRLEVEGPSCHARSDSTLLRAILGNLLGNAIKYSPADSPVLLRLVCHDGRVHITVRDHGPGLRAEDLPNLFSTFYRGSNAAGIPGTGLGLAIVKRCAESLGGTVSARNAADGGAEFSVNLPLVISPPP